MSRAEVDARLAQLSVHDWRPRFQIVLAMDSEISCDTPAWRTLDSLSRQAYPDWRLQLVVEPGPAAPMPMSQVPHCLLESFGDIAERITLRQKGGRETVAFGLGDPLPPASAELVLILRAGDELGCDALLEFALASALEPDADFLYSDDRRPSPEDERIEPFFKPGWSPELLLGWNYIGRCWCASQSVFRKAGLRPSRLPDCDDHDLVLRLTERSRRIVHVPKVLGQLGLDWSKGVTSEIETVEAAMKRRGLAGEVQLGRWPGHYRIKRDLARAGLVSIIVPTRAAGGHIVTCIESLRRFTRYQAYEIICVENIPAGHSDCRGWLYKNAHSVIHSTQPFHVARYNNLGAAKAKGQYLVFLHDVVKAVDPDWLEALLEHAQQAETGVVGAQLLYPDCSVQHAGLVLDEDGRQRQPFQLLSADDGGYFGLALSERNVIGVTGACQMMRREVFERFGGFDEAEGAGHYDLDFCLRAHNAGLRNVYTPYARLIHFEVDSSIRPDHHRVTRDFRERWGRRIAAGDPYFNPNLSRGDEPWRVERDPLEILYPARPLLAAEAVRSILVVKLEGVAEAVAALPAVRSLKRLFPHARVAVLASCATYSIWKMEPAVDEILEFNPGEPHTRPGRVIRPDEDLDILTGLLRRRRFDLAADLGHRPETRTLLRNSGARWLAGYDDNGHFPWLDVVARLKHGGSSPDRGESAGDALVEQIAAASAPALPDADESVLPLKLPNGLLRALFTKPLVCLHPALGTLTRQWPMECFGLLIDLLLTGADVNVAVIGDAEDREASEKLLSRDDGVAGIRGRLFDLVGKLGPSGLPALVARSSLYIGRDGRFRHQVGTVGSPGQVFIPELWTLRSNHRRDLGRYTGTPRRGTPAASPQG